MRILICDANRAPGLMEAMLRKAGHLVTSAADGGDLIQIAASSSHDVILFDPALPDMTGLDCLRALRHAQVTSPICLLSPSSDVDARIRALEAGADDCIQSPIHGRELTARLAAVARRAAGLATPLVHFGALAINLADRGVTFAGQPVPLTNTESRILELMALRRGRTVTKEMILSWIYGMDEEPHSKTIDVFICKIRKKIADLGGEGAYVATVWGRGYMLQDPLSTRKAA